MQETMELYQFRCKKLIEDGKELEELNDYDNFKELFTEQQFKVVMNEKQKRKNKRYRTKNMFNYMYKIAMVMNNQNAKVVFGTITLDDYHLNLKEDTYIRKIDKWLKKHFVYSIVNKDFGSKTEREHYHFIGLTTEEIETKGKVSKKGYEIFELVDKDYKLGFEPTLCLIDLNISDSDKTINYLLKLNNHSNKLGTKSRVRVIKSPLCKTIEMLWYIKPTKAEKRAKGKVKNWVLKG